MTNHVRERQQQDQQQGRRRRQQQKQQQEEDQLFNHYSSTKSIRFFILVVVLMSSQIVLVAGRARSSLHNPTYRKFNPTAFCSTRSAYQVPIAFVSSTRTFQQQSPKSLPNNGQLETCFYKILSNNPQQWNKYTVVNSQSSLSSLSSLQSFSTRLFSTTSKQDAASSFFAQDAPTFESIGIQSQLLLERLETHLQLRRPTSIQAVAFSKIRERNTMDPTKSCDVTIGAETGSGKTLAYLLPILDDILQEKAKANEAGTDNGNVPELSYDYARALILVPNKELVQQIVRMALPLCGGDQALIWGGNSMSEDAVSSSSVNADPRTIIRVAIMPGGLAEPMDFKPFRDSIIGLGGSDDNHNHRAPPVDLVISTPAAVGPLGLKPNNVELFADIPTLVVDEADMLLDGGYIKSLEQVLLGFRRADKLVHSSSGEWWKNNNNENDDDNNVAGGAILAKTQHIFVAATLPDCGLRSVDAYLQKKFPYATRITMDGMHNAKHYGLRQPTVWIAMETKRERMDQLTELLQTKPDICKDSLVCTNNGLQGEKVMVFLNSVEDVQGVYNALERAGIAAVPYHAKLKLGERAENLDRFRPYRATCNDDDKDKDTMDNDTVPILVCTDLASRGLDVPGVTVVVQMQFAGNVVSHLHRMGRCGRAGNRTGRGIVFYDPMFEQELVSVVQLAEEQQERMDLEGDVQELNVEEVGSGAVGTVENAFSRKRGFTKKRKKLRREQEEGNPN